MKNFHCWMALLAGAVLVFCPGCSTPETRAQDKSDAFSKVPKKFREAALKGELREGMNADAVFVALGDPARVSEGQQKGVKFEKWIYTRMQSQDIPAWREVYERDNNGRVIAFQRYDPVHITRIEDALEVRFENGKVVGWEKK